MLARAAQARKVESGVSMVLFAIVIVAVVGVAALVVDLGFLFGQRRFDQNGADAAALAAGRMLAQAVSPRNANGDVYFVLSDSEVYKAVRLYAGLDPSSASDLPTGVNQNPLMTARNALAVSLEYSPDGGATWCYSPSGPQPPRNPPVTECVLPPLVMNGTTIYLPPYPSGDPTKPYRIRVTVSSTTDSFFWSAFATLMGSTSPDVTPPPPTDQAVPACLRSTGATGNTTCAQAVVSVKGSPDYVGQGPIIPVTTGDCQIGEDTRDGLFELWGSNPDGCGFNINPWKNMLDFTDENKWCDDLSGGSGPNPDYGYYKLLPISTTNTLRIECQRDDPANHILGWDRQGFIPDTTWPGTGQTDNDIPGWIARGFNGTIRAAFFDGNKMPTYVDANPSQGSNLGNNIALGFYCNNPLATTESSCSINPAGTYFFAKTQPGFMNICDDEYGQNFGAGCREAVVPAWGDDTDPVTGAPGNFGDVQWATGLNNGGNGWTNGGGGGPDRVRIVELLNMRLYCDHDTPGDPRTLCTQPPKSIVGNAATSTVWGRFKAWFIPGPCPNCNGGPTIHGNVAVLEQ